MKAIVKLLPMIAFCLYFLKIGILGAQYPDAFILGILSAFAGFIEYKNSDAKIKELNDKVETRQKELELYVKDIDNLKSAVASIKMTTGMRPMNVNSNR